MVVERKMSYYFGWKWLESVLAGAAPSPWLGERGHVESLLSTTRVFTTQELSPASVGGHKCPMKVGVV